MAQIKGQNEKSYKYRSCRSFSPLAIRLWAQVEQEQAGQLQDPSIDFDKVANSKAKDWNEHRKWWIGDQAEATQASEA